MNNYLFWKRFAQGKLRTHVSSVKIRIPSPKEILSWSERRLSNSTLVGKLDNAHTVEHDTLKPVSGGLFCERIFGPIATNVCACLRRKGWNEDYCKICEVQFTKSRLRRYQMGHILLAAPIIHIWALQGGYLANLLGKKNLGIRSIAHGKVMCQSKLWKSQANNQIIKFSYDGNNFAACGTNLRCGANLPSTSFLVPKTCGSSTPSFAPDRSPSINLNQRFKKVKLNNKGNYNFVSNNTNLAKKIIIFPRTLHTAGKEMPSTKSLASAYRTEGNPLIQPSATLRPKVADFQSENLTKNAILRIADKANLFLAEPLLSSILIRPKVSSPFSKKQKLGVLLPQVLGTKKLVDGRLAPHRRLVPHWRLSTTYLRTKKLKVLSSFARNSSTVLDNLMLPLMEERPSYCLASLPSLSAITRGEASFSLTEARHSADLPSMLRSTYPRSSEDGGLASKKPYATTYPLCFAPGSTTFDRSVEPKSSQNQRSTKNISLGSPRSQKVNKKFLPTVKTLVYKKEHRKIKNQIQKVYERGNILPFHQFLLYKPDTFNKITQFFNSLSKEEKVFPLPHYSKQKLIFYSSSGRGTLGTWGRKAHFANFTTRLYYPRIPQDSLVCKSTPTIAPSTAYRTTNKACLGLRPLPLVVSQVGILPSVRYAEALTNQKFVNYEQSSWKRSTAVRNAQLNQKDTIRDFGVFSRSDTLSWGIFYFYDRYNFESLSNLIASYKNKKRKKQFATYLVYSAFWDKFLKAKISLIRNQLCPTVRKASSASCFLDRSAVRRISSKVVTESYRLKGGRLRAKLVVPHAAKLVPSPGKKILASHPQVASCEASSFLGRNVAKQPKTSFARSNAINYAKLLKYHGRGAKIYYHTQKKNLPTNLKIFKKNKPTASKLIDIKNITYTGSSVLFQSLKNLNLVLLDSLISWKWQKTRIELNKFLLQNKLRKKKRNLRNKIAKTKIILTKRKNLVQSFLSTSQLPEWMIISILPVLPPALRPILELEPNNVVVSDLNVLYQTVIRRNDALMGLLTFRALEIDILNRQVSLQQAIEKLFDKGAGTKKRPVKSLSQGFHGKKGLFRSHLLGKRVDYSGRSVIVVGPQLKLYECGLPKEMALVLFLPFLIARLKKRKVVTNTSQAKQLIFYKDKQIWSHLKALIYEHPVLLNRAPTLHRLGFQAFQPILVSGKAMILPALVCTGFNADFDGDQMAVHVPLSHAARAESWKLLHAKNNMLSPATGKPIIVLSQEMILGCYCSSLILNKTHLLRNTTHRLASLRAVTSEARRTAPKVSTATSFARSTATTNFDLGLGSRIPKVGIQDALRYAQTNQRFVDYYERSSSWELKSSSKHNTAPLLSSTTFYASTSGRAKLDMRHSSLSSFSATTTSKARFGVPRLLRIQEALTNQRFVRSVKSSMLPSVDAKRANLRCGTSSVFTFGQTKTGFDRRLDAKQPKTSFARSAVRSSNFNLPSWDPRKNFWQQQSGTTEDRRLKLCDNLYFTTFQEIYKALGSNKITIQTAVWLRIPFFEDNQFLEEPLEIRLNAMGHFFRSYCQSQRHFSKSIKSKDQIKGISYVRTSAGRIQLNETFYSSWYN